jgi:hypothetical protein
MQPIQEARMASPDFSAARWRKANGSGEGGCVEVAYQAGWIGVRDTKNNGAGPVLAFTEHEWLTFLDGAHNGEFALDQLAD